MAGDSAGRERERERERRNFFAVRQFHFWLCFDKFLHNTLVFQNLSRLFYNFSPVQKKYSLEQRPSFYQKPIDKSDMGFYMSFNPTNLSHAPHERIWLNSHLLGHALQISESDKAGQFWDTAK